MKDSKSLYSRCFVEYRLTEEKLKRLQAELLAMLVDLKTVCDKYRIDYMLCGGTALGAVRHHGFIPWDDDADVMMLRSEFERLKEVFEQELSDRYVLAEPLSDPLYVSKMVKIFKKGSVFVEIPTAGVGGPDMLFLDLFPIESVPAPGLRRTLKGIAYNTAHKAASLCVDYQYPSPPIMEKGKIDRELRRYYATRRTLGFFFAHLGGMKRYLGICERLAKQTDQTGWLGIPSDGDYFGRIYPADLFTEVTETDFCGFSMKIPRDYDAYLRQEYGDYLRLPPPEEREYHSAFRVSFGESDPEGLSPDAAAGKEANDTVTIG